MKKIFCFIVSIILIFSLISCVNVFADENTKDTTLESAIDAETSNSVIVSETTGDLDTTSETEITSEAEEETTTSFTYPGKGFDTFKSYSFPILIFGMLGIFIVLGLIALCIYFLSKVFGNNKKDN